MTQVEKIYNLLKDGLPHRTDEILIKCYGNEHQGLARIGARKFDIQERYGVEIKGWKDPEKPSLFWYQIQNIVSDTPTPKAPYKSISYATGLSTSDDQKTLFPLEPLPHIHIM